MSADPSCLSLSPGSCLQREQASPGGVPALGGDGPDPGDLCWGAHRPDHPAGSHHRRHSERVRRPGLVAGASSIPPSQLSPSPPPQHYLGVAGGDSAALGRLQTLPQAVSPCAFASHWTQSPALCDTRHGRGHWGPSSKVLGMSLPPLQLCCTVPLPHIFWSFASFPAASWLCAALVILHGWKCFWPCPSPAPLLSLAVPIPNSSPGTPGCAALHPQPKMTKISSICAEMLPLGFPVALARPV